MESEFEDGLSGQIEKISKEQLYQSFKKMLNRYNKYKGRYTDLLKHYKELQHENFKTKNVLQVIIIISSFETKKFMTCLLNLIKLWVICFIGKSG